MLKNIILICFAGRKKYLDIQIKYILKLLNENCSMEYHLWNFSRNHQDNIYLQGLVKLHDRIKIFNDYYEGDNKNLTCNKKVGVICNCIKCRVGKWSEPYKFYKNKIYENSIFIKLDDDIVYMTINKINYFIECIKNNPNKIVSSNVINNSICAIYNEEIKKKLFDNNLINYNSSFRDYWFKLTINKLFFNLSHDYFIEKFNNNNLNLENTLIYTNKTRFSINNIGFTYDVMCKIANLLKNEVGMNDESIISDNFNILICNSFISVHFYFSDQRSQLSDEEEIKYLNFYKNI